MAPIGLAFAVLETLDGSKTELGVVLLARAAPQVAFILIGGVVADRLPRHAVMVGANLLSMLTQGGVAALLLVGHARLWEIVGLSAVNGTSASLFFPASQGIVPQTVPPELIQQANALLRLALNSANVLGAAAGGALVAATSPGWAIAIDAASFGVAALLTVPIALPEIVRETATSFVQELAEGWNAFRSRTWLWSIVLQFSVLNAAFAGAEQVLGPAQASAHYGGSKLWGAILAFQGAGLIAGGVVMLRARPARMLLLATFSCLLLAPRSRCSARLRTGSWSRARRSSRARGSRSSPSAGTRPCRSRSPGRCCRASTPTTRSARSASFRSGSRRSDRSPTRSGRRRRSTARRR